MWFKSTIIFLIATIFWKWLLLPLKQEDYKIAFLDTPDVAQKHGYNVETYHVRTADDYLLTLHRIPGKGRPVLLQHGIVQSSASFIITGPGHALGYQLADSGYDVWLANSRGNYYSQGHVDASVSRRRYWDFSWHEMGVYDLPATIDTILNVTGRQQVHFICYSMGCTVFFVMASSQPEYNTKVTAMVALAPPVFLGHSTSILAYCGFVGSLYLQRILDAVEVYQFLPRHRIFAFMGVILCGMDRATCSICKGIYSLIGGHNPTNQNQSLLAVIYGHDPSGTSMKTAMHYGQLMLSGRFRQYDYGGENVVVYGQTQPPDYDLSKVTVPVTIFYGGADTACDPQDIEKLFNKLTASSPKLMHQIHDYTHMDFTCGADMNKQVYQRIASSLDNQYHV